jgi:hypothetical protein
MATELYRDRFGVIIHEPDKRILELEWLSGTAEITDDEAKGWLERYAAFGEQHKPAFMVIDAREFKYQWGEGMDVWRNEHIIPRYNAAGVKKFAFLLPAGAVPAGEPSVEDPATFPTGYFDSRAKIIEWFSN